MKGHLRMRRLKHVLTIRRAALALAVALSLGVATATGASADANDVQFNLLGWQNGAGWGNDGQVGSVNWMWYMTTLYNNQSGSWPFAATFSEVCRDNNDPNFTSQWDLLAWDLGSIGMRGGWWIEDNTQSLKPGCWQGGDAAFGVGDTVWGSFPFGAYGAWTDQGPSHVRGYACPNIRISYFNFNYRVCSTHLESNNDTRATNQLGEANDNYFAYGVFGVPTLYGGDFNLSPTGNPGNAEVSTWIFDTNHFEGGSNLNKTYPTGAAAEKIDYFAYATPTWHVLHTETTIAPGNQTCFCSGNNHPYSDHLLLRVYIST